MARAAVAAAAVIVVTAVAFGPRDFLLWTVTGNGGYLALRGSLLGSALRGIGMTGAFLVFNGVLVWCCVVARRRGAVDRRPVAVARRRRGGGAGRVPVLRPLLPAAASRRWP